MKGIILAGGKGERLKPLTDIIPKHLLPYGPRPIIYYSLMTLKNAGIEEVMIVVNKEGAGLTAKYVGNGFGLDISYKIQEEPKGIAHALYLTRRFVGDDDCVVILPDNIFEDDVSRYIRGFNGGAMVFLAKVDNPEEYGVAEIKNERIVSIEEKPEKPKGNACIVGLYLYDNQVFDIIRAIKPSKRGELEITSVNNEYLKKCLLDFRLLEGPWKDIGTFKSLEGSKCLYLDIMTKITGPR